MKKVILVLVVLALAGCLSKPSTVETVVVLDSTGVKIDSAVADSTLVVDSLKAK